MTAPLVEFRNVSFAYEEEVVLRDVSLTVAPGQLVAIMGGSGSGKTTLLKLIGGQIRPDCGEVLVDGENVGQLNERALYRLRRKLGMLFQFGALFTDLSVFDNVAFPLRERTDLPESMIRDLVLMKLQAVGLRGAAALMPAELSGGMVKRVALARALSLEPELLVLDEPTAGLDPDLADNFVGLIRMLQQELGFTVVMVTHDLETLGGLATRVAVLAEQRIIACGTPTEVLAVDHPFIRSFFCSEHAKAVMQKRLA